MQIKKFNISKPKKYIKDNVEKTQWNNIGTITEFHKDDGSVSRILEIPAINLEANIFPFTDPAQVKAPSQGLQPGYMTPKTETPTIQYENGEVNPQDIPF